MLAALLTYHAQAKIASPLAQRFVEMIKKRQVEKLDEWIADAYQCVIIQLKQFAGDLQRDYDASTSCFIYGVEQWAGGRADYPLKTHQTARLWQN